MENSEKSSWGFGRFFLGFFAILLGFIFLAENFGLINGINWGDVVLKIWPIFIIFSGLSLISQGGWAAKLIAVFLTIVTIAVVFTMLFNYFNSDDLYRIYYQFSQCNLVKLVVLLSN